MTRDNAGNWSALGQSAITNIEHVPPVLGFDGATNGGTYSSPQTITPNSTDPISGIASQYVSGDNATWVTSMLLSSSSTIYCKATDNAGNTVSGLCGTITIASLPDWVVYDGDPGSSTWSWMGLAHETKVTSIPGGTRVIYDYSNACAVSGHTTMAQQLYVAMASWSGNGSVFFDWYYPNWARFTGSLSPLAVVRMELQGLGSDLLYGFKGLYPTGPDSQSVPQAEFVGNGVIFAIEGQGSLNPFSLLKSVAIQCHASN